MAMKRGLPERANMRHDSHYVEELTRRSGRHIGAMIPLSLIEANPDQPRTQLGNIEELAASIREKGVLEPILVRAIGPNRYQIISGERRFRAATLVGLDEIPAIELDVDDKEMLEIALIENIQRKDLTPFEESEALHSLATRCGYTHEDMARKLGKSRTSVTESLSLNNMPDEVKNLCRLADISSKSLLLEIVRQGDPQKMVALIEKISRDGGATREAVRKDKEAAKPKAGRPKHYTFKYKAPTKLFNLQL
ncbi:MAG TPA: ParB/RepB/Spo0J family partition protein, partial [Gemmatimonadaceae bacterium]|nr:ParB/RepB/Spo0J family partition protein [Gemmatimonadaceae bacterium]